MRKYILKHRRKLYAGCAFGITRSILVIAIVAIVFYTNTQHKLKLERNARDFCKAIVFPLFTIATSSLLVAYLLKHRE